MESALCEHELEDAASLLEKAGDWEDAGELLEECRERLSQMRLESKYRAACVMLKDARSENGCLMAKKLLEELGDYLDAPEKAKECAVRAEACRKEEIYQDAVKHMNRPGDDVADIDTAMDLFAQVPDYRDSAELLERCRGLREETRIRAAEHQEKERKRREKRNRQLRNLKRACIITPVALLLIAGMILLHIFYLIPEKKYRNAAGLLAEGKYEAAYDVYAQIPGYRDVRTILRTDEGLLQVWQNRFLIGAREPGSIVTFGTFEQDYKPANGPEDIEWTVLSYDAEKDRALLYSRYVLDCRRFNDLPGDTDWEKCSLRVWMNGDFLAQAFDDRLRGVILLTELDNSAAQSNSQYGSADGNNTQDYVFLLSYAELMDLIPRAEDRVCEPTLYAREHEVGGHSDRYFLRSPGFFGDYAGLAFSDGMSTGAETGGRRGVRPAIWVDLKALESTPAEE